MSACDKYLEVMLPVDDLKGASRAIAPDCGSRGKNEPEVGRICRRSNNHDTVPQDRGATDWFQVGAIPRTNSWVQRSLGDGNKFGLNGRLLVLSQEVGSLV